MIMHPGPINQGVEITSEVADSDQAIILDQVENGVQYEWRPFICLLQKLIEYKKFAKFDGVDSSAHKNDQKMNFVVEKKDKHTLITSKVEKLNNVVAPELKGEVVMLDKNGESS